MSERTCVLVRNFPLASLRKDEIAELENGLRDMSETTVLIFFFGTINFEYGKKDFQKWTDIVNLVSKYGICAQLDNPIPSNKLINISHNLIFIVFHYFIRKHMWAGISPVLTLHFFTPYRL